MLYGHMLCCFALVITVNIAVCCIYGVMEANNGVTASVMPLVEAVATQLTNMSRGFSS